MNEWIRRASLLGGVVLALSPLAAPSQRTNPDRADDFQQLVLILDPTVGRIGEVSARDGQLNQIAAIYSVIPEQTCIQLFIVAHRRIAAAPDDRACFPFHSKTDARRRHRREVQAALDRAAGLYRQRWQAAHAVGVWDHSESCLLSTFNRAGRNRVGPRPVLIVLSDMLETCDEWQDLNMEQWVEQGRFPNVSVAGAADLSHFTVQVVIVPHYRTGTIQSLNLLQQFWTRALRQLHASRVEFPSQIQNPFEH